MYILPEMTRRLILPLFFYLTVLSLSGSQHIKSRDPDALYFSNADPFPQYGYAQPEPVISPAAKPFRSSSHFDNVATAVTEFSLEMFKDIVRSAPGNVVSSPISMATILALLQQATVGSSLKELEKALHMPKDLARTSYAGIVENIKAKRSRNEIYFVNGMFVSNGYSLNSNFVEVASRDFGAQVTNVNFRNPSVGASIINHWVNQNTRGKIPNIVNPASIDRNTDCILANAVYFKGVWESTFPKERSVPRVFHPVADQQITCDFMYQTGKFIAGEDLQLGARWVELPFDQKQFSMFFVLPTSQHDLNGLVNRMTSADLSKILTSGGLIKVTMGIPKFNINFEKSLVDTLQNMGIRQIFTTNSGITELGGGRPVYISQAVQKASMSIDEAGSVAAAATFVAVNTLSLSSYMDEFYFIANQPFLAIIVEKTNNVPIFMSRIYDPTKPN